MAPGGAVTWENHDRASAHPIECAQPAGYTACPWSGRLALPAAGTAPTTVCVVFPRPGVYSFRDPTHPSMTGQVVVGAPPRGAPAAPSSSHYTLSVHVGNQHVDETFTLAPNEFKIIVVTMP